MTRVIVPLLSLVLGLSAGVPLGAIGQPGRQGGAAQGQPAQETSAVILGRVVDADTGAAISGAVVTLAGRPAAARGRAAPPIPTGGNMFDLIAARGRGPERVAADAEGRFVFRNLAASRYTLRAQAEGYVQNLGAVGRAAGGGPAIVPIEAGQSAARATVRMWKEAVLTGVVVDEASEPIIGARVVAYQRTISPLGQIAYNSSKTATTDDRGRYRMYGMTPGSYLVAVPQSQSTALAAGADAMIQGLLSGQMPEGGLGAIGPGASPMDPDAVRVGEWRLSSGNVKSPPAAADGALYAYRTVFHPATFSASNAASITLRSGEERSAIDFTLAPVLTGRITGTVMGPAGPERGVPVRLVPAGDTLPGGSSLPDVARGQTSADGRFTLLAVPAGQYRVIAEREVPDFSDMPEEMLDNPMIQLAMTMRGSGSALYGETVASVADGEVADIVIAGSAGVTVDGRIEFEGTPPEDPTQVRVVIRSLGAASRQARPIRVDAERRFTLEAVLPGRYAAATTPAGPTGQWMVRAVTANGRDATKAPIVVEGDDVTLVVTLTNQTGSLIGTVRQEVSATGAPAAPGAPRSLIALVAPVDYASFSDLEMAADRIRFTPVATDGGTFRVGPVVAGDYLVAVVDEADVDFSLGLGALQALAAQATRVTIAPGDTTSVTVGVIGGDR